MNRTAVHSLIIAATLVLTVGLFSPQSSRVVAATPQASVSPSAIPTSSDTMDANTEAVAEYTLPYPGMLPDSPLYFLKQTRDWILDKLIVDPVRRVDFNILQADKRLSMGMSLMAKGNGSLAEATISKGEKYLNSAVYGLVAQKNEGKEVPAYLVERLSRSLAKHTTELTRLIAQSQDQVKTGLQGSLTLVTKLTQELTKLQ